MELNLSEFLLKLGKQQKEEILKQVYKEMDLNFDNMKSLLTFSNAENDGLRLGGNKEISNFLIRLFYSKLNNTIFEDEIKSVYDLSSKISVGVKNQQIIKDKFILYTGNEKLNNFLKGGFIPGNIYEITGASLSGKSYFLYKLISKNFNKIQKTIFFDINDSFKLKLLCDQFSISKEKLFEKIEVIKIIDFQGLIQSLKEIQISLTNTNNNFQKINFIFIDSLSLIANRMIIDKSKDNDLQTKFNQILNILISEFKIGIIFTVCPVKIKDKQFFDFSCPGSNMLLKESESSLAGAIVIPIDYSLCLINPRFNYRGEGINCRKFLCKIKSEKIHPFEQLIEITNID